MSSVGATSGVYVEQMYEEWKHDPASVHTSWRHYFENVNNGIEQGYVAPPTLGARQVPAIFVGGGSAASSSSSSSSSSLSSTASTAAAENAVKLYALIRGYQARGHHMASLDPLGRERILHRPRELEPEFYGFSEADMDTPIALNGRVETPREVIERLSKTYCSTVGLEFTHVQSRPQQDFLRRKIEEFAESRRTETPQELVLERLTWSDNFERFLEVKFSGAKRFGLEGCEATIPALQSLVDRAAELGVENVCLGMPHRGRLNVLANVMQKPLKQIFAEFSGSARASVGSGDVKYHLGTSSDVETRSGHLVHLSLVANPSHLEAVNPVVEGKVRAKQHYAEDNQRKRSMSVLMHGDAAFAGQGVVYESMHINDLPSYTTGGTVHIVVNNQIGFTTDPQHSRSTPYPTDVGKALGCPILHVNGDDVDACVWAFETAVEFRQQFGKSFVLDLVGYRKHGHNEIDAPDMTQPLMYQLIRAKRSVLNMYRDRLDAEQSPAALRADAIAESVLGVLRERFEASKQAEASRVDDWLESKWKGFKSPGQRAKIKTTGVPPSVLEFVGNHITTLPDDFTPHKTIARVIKRQRAALAAGKDIDWATAEALAFGSLLLEGNHVRLSGQDVERGTFSHRHAVLHDQATGQRYVPLSAVEKHSPPASSFSVYNSSLSEFGVLGFELGYSMENPNSLVLWEAQFGDFANGAQTIFDQFLSSGEEKWLRQAGLVCLLPHGYDGQGPEHSSARLERFLSMSNSHPYRFEYAGTYKAAEEQVQAHNWQVVNISTPANYFHVLRRQIHREFRKPLIVMSPKNLLRHPECVSQLSEFDDVADDCSGETADIFFQRVIGETDSDVLETPANVKRIVFCSGKIYYELRAARRAGQINDVAIVRVEQLAPFPFDAVLTQAALYPNAEIAWCQEEPMNMGAWWFVHHHMRGSLRQERGAHFEPIYFGREPAASPSTGYLAVHNAEQKELIGNALDSSTALPENQHK
jgi:2-oxoglutarate dehydrogenase E1 component